MLKRRAIWTMAVTISLGVLSFTSCQKDVKEQEVKESDESQIPMAHSPVKGAQNPKVTIVGFSNFQCGFCARVAPTLDKILEEYPDDVRIVFKHNPLPFHKDAPLAAEATIEAHAQGKFWEMTQKLYDNMRNIKREDLDKYAEELKLDMNQFKEALDTNKHKAVWEADQKLAADLGARGTPAFFINGTFLSGARPFENFKEVIDKELEQVNELLEKEEVALIELYDLRVKENFKPQPAKPAADKDRPKRPQEDPNAIYKVEVGTSPTKGADDALVTIVEFSNFQCPFCARAVPTVKQIQEEYKDKVRFVFKHNPLPFHKLAPTAAKASLAGHEQGKFWEMVEKLYANPKNLEREDLDRFAGEVGLNMDKYKAYMDADKGQAQIDADMKLAAQIGARGTPSFFINGRKLAGAQPFPNFKRIIDEEIKKAEAMLEKGVEKKDLYNEIIKDAATTPQFLAGTGPKIDPSKKLDVDALRRRGAAAGAGADTRQKVEVGDAPSVGPKDAKVTIVEFSNFQCGFCGRVLPTMKQIKEEYGDKVRIAFKHNPMSWPNAQTAAEATMAAHEQGKFWEMHDILFQNSRALTREDVDGYAEKIGMNMERFKKSMDEGKWKAHIDADQKQAAALGARGTPTFFINGRLLRGAQPFEAFKAIIDEELKGKE